MADRIEFELVSPERLLLSQPVGMVVVPGGEGDFGALPGHAPMISTIRAGVIATYEDGRVDRRIFVAGGFAEVTPERCTVLAEEAAPLDSIDMAQAEARVAAAGEAVEAARTDEERAAAEARLAVAQALRRAVDAASR